MPLRQVHEIEEVIPIRTLRPLPKQPDGRSRRLPSRSGIGSACTAVQSLCDWRRTNSLRPSIVSLAGFPSAAPEMAQRKEFSSN